jgi:hypothetical protein
MTDRRPTGDRQKRRRGTMGGWARRGRCRKMAREQVVAGQSQGVLRREARGARRFEGIEGPGLREYGIVDA